MLTVASSQPGQLLEIEGLGANLQHFNFHPGITAEIKSTFDIP